VHHRYEVKDGNTERRPSFLDLGMGFGKISVLAALLGFDSGGYELARPRIRAACRALGRLGGGSGESSLVEQRTGGGEGAGPSWLKQHRAEHFSVPTQSCALGARNDRGQVSFFEGSFTHEKVSLEDTDVVFTDSVLWDGSTMRALGEKASRMKPGSIIVSYKPFPGDSFDNLQSLTLPTSWSGGQGVNFFVQQVAAKEAKNLRRAARERRRERIAG